NTARNRYPRWPAKTSRALRRMQRGTSLKLTQAAQAAGTLRLVPRGLRGCSITGTDASSRHYRNSRCCSSDSCCCSGCDSIYVQDVRAPNEAVPVLSDVRFPGCGKSSNSCDRHDGNRHDRERKRQRVRRESEQFPASRLRISICCSTYSLQKHLLAMRWMSAGKHCKTL